MGEHINMDKLTQLKKEWEFYQAVMARIEQVRDEIRDEKRRYENSPEHMLCEIIASGGDHREVIGPAIRYGAISLTLQNLDKTRGYASGKLNEIQSQLDYYTQELNASRSSGIIKELARDLTNDPFNNRIKVKLLNHLVDYGGMNKREANEMVSQIVNDGKMLLNS